MKFRIIYRLILVFQLAIMASCEEVMLKDDPPPEPLIVFDYLWKDIKNRYSFFDEKNINWDSLRVVYREKAEKKINEYELFSILSDMLSELQDGHVNLSSTFNRSRTWEWYRNYPLNYNETVIESRYLGKDYRITGPFKNRVIDSVLYINYRSFSVEVSDSHLDQLMLRAVGMKGVIIDVRSNGGGSLKNAYRLASCFSDRPYHFARQRIKTGPGKEDFSAWKDMTVQAREGTRFPGQVIVLTNRTSYSATTFFAQIMKMLPNALLIGDQTGGGGGTPVFGELPNGWIYSFSASQTVNLEGDQLEFGVPVDQKVNIRTIDDQNGYDTIIETALRLLR